MSNAFSKEEREAFDQILEVLRSNRPEDQNVNLSYR